MQINRKILAGIFVCLSLALLMVRDMDLISSDFLGFLGALLGGLFISYKITAYMFGWTMPMLTLTGGLKKGKHDILRAIMFVFFTSIWLILFFR